MPPSVLSRGVGWQVWLEYLLLWSCILYTTSKYFYTPNEGNQSHLLQKLRRLMICHSSLFLVHDHCSRILNSSFFYIKWTSVKYQFYKNLLWSLSRRCCQFFYMSWSYFLTSLLQLPLFVCTSGSGHIALWNFRNWKRVIGIRVGFIKLEYIESLYEKIYNWHKLCLTFGQFTVKMLVC